MTNPTSNPSSASNTTKTGQPFGMTSAKHSGKDEADRIAEENEVLDLKRLGLSDRKIAQKLGVTHTTVQNRLKAALTRYGSAAADDLRKITDDRLESLFESLELGIRAGDPQSVSVALRVLDRRAKLHGLDAPTQIEITQESESDREIKTLLGQMKTSSAKARSGLEAIE